ncbi:glycerophosphodiester phosphodiesterase family protein [Nereida sp. MMG025]|uniref:glycerophosphodiester phosphodiesterase family protein n=1 Tax=Nereida sp. MMG025 TaxID=2909981 RepID=UPI001F38806B|nr:glycerophosphodiester phosphodiesterase family protein [Nereida sp. MMG025]
MPIAHRALHDITDGRPENSRAAIRAAIEHGYGIEIDLQLSKDGQAMVFHDYDLARLSAGEGPIQQQTRAQLGATQLKGGNETIPSLIDALEIIEGQVPLLIELKDQDGAMGEDGGVLEKAVCATLRDYDGPTALMSFNPYSVARCAELAPNIPRGLVTCDYTAEDWPTLSATTRNKLARIPDFDRVGASFISHDRKTLDLPQVAAIKDAGHPVLTWTIRSPAQEHKARQVADNITFEGYLA